MSFILKNGYSKGVSDLPTSERFEYWQEAVCNEFVHLDCENASEGEFEGRIRGGVDLNGLKFAEVKAFPHRVHRSKRQIAKTSEENFLISFQIANSCVLRQDGREAELTPGCLALYDSTRPYSLAFDSEFHQLIVHMPRSVLARHIVSPEKYTATPISGNNGLGAVLSNFVFSLAAEMSSLQQASDEISENFFNLIALCFSSTLMLNDVKHNLVVRESLQSRIRQFIEYNLCDPQLTIKTIAQSQGISTRYLHKLFQDYEESVHEYIQNRRLGKAYHFLSDPKYTETTIENIALNLGFTSAAHFSKVFKNRFGFSPSEMR